MYGQKFLRGQVWWIGTNKEYVGTIQSPNRPHVIVSNNVGNRNAGHLMVVPCTTELKRLDMPTHLECEFGNKRNMIMCEQIKTVNVDELLSYMFTLDDNMMDKIDEALKIALGIVDNKLLDTVAPISDIENDKMTSDEIVEAVVPQIKIDDEKTNIVELSMSKNGKQKRWDTDTKKEYVNWYEQYGKKATSERYNTGTNTKLYYLRFCKALNMTPLEEVNGVIR